MKFEDFSLSKETLKALLEMGFEEPTPIQESTIPLIMEGLDIVGQAQTGTGKTAAFGIPIVERCKRQKNPFAIIVEPTRELAVQVSQEISKLGKYSKVNVLPVYGGKSIDAQIKSLNRGVNLIVGTPGRILDHINRKTLSLSDIEIVVLDEADEMLNMGFIEDIEMILKNTPSERQTLLFSATMPQPILNIAKRYMNDPQKVRINSKEIVVTKIKQVFYEVREHEKIDALSRLLDVEDPQLAIIFCHTKREVDDVSEKLQQMGYNANAIHGDYKQSKRDEVMGKFKKGTLDILVATDVAARGLDIKNVSHVINYSIPQNTENYIHRIGRTGRAGNSGIAITFVTPREYNYLKMVERDAKIKIDKKKLPSPEDVISARGKVIVKELVDIIEDGKQATYSQMIQELKDNFSPDDIAAAALYRAYGEVKPKMEEERERRQGDSHVVRLFMTIGKKDKIQVADIVRSIASEANIPSHKIGKIEVLDKFTFAEVPADLAEQVIHSIDEMIVKGKKVRVQEAHRRK